MNKVVIVFLILLTTLGACKSKKNATNSNGKLNHSSQKEDNKIEQLLIKATTEKVLGNDEDAKLLFLDILKLRPNLAIAHFELSEIYQKKRLASETVEHAEKAVKYAPDNEWYKASLAKIYHNTSQYAKAEKTYQELIAADPKNHEYKFNLAEVYLYQGKLKETLPLYNSIEEKLGVTEELSLHKNKIYMELNQPDSAIVQVQKLIATNPHEVRYYGILAELYESKGAEQNALKNYKKILELDPNNGYVHMSLYDYYKFHGQKDIANQELTKAFESPKVILQSKVELLSEFFVNSERNEELKTRSYELLEILIRVHPTESKAYAIYSDFLARDSRDEETINMLSKAVELDETNFNLQYQLMMLLSTNQKNQELADRSGAASEIFPTHATFYYFNGIANLQLKEYEKAIESFELGKDLVIENPQLKAEFYQYLGDANHYIENHTQSDFYYDESLTLVPDNVYVLNNYSYYLSLRKTSLQKAENMSRKVNTLSPNNATYMDTYGWVLYVAKKYDEAAEWLQKAVTNGAGSNGEVLEHYGDALYQLDRIDEAVSYWEKAAKHTGASQNIQEKITKKKLIE